MPEDDEYVKQLRIAEQALVLAIRARPTTFDTIIVTILAQVRALLPKQ